MDDDEDEAIAYYDREDDEENIEYRELDLDNLVLEASQVDTTGICTVAQKDRLKNPDQTSESNDKGNKNETQAASCKKYIIIYEFYKIVSDFIKLHNFLIYFSYW